jgi:hypothetical protein
MSDLKLFRITDGKAEELTGSAAALEKHLQILIEGNMSTLFGIRFLASEYNTGSKHRGRIDSLGLDENGSPVIFEYKRTNNENVVNQGLIYLDWLLDHRAEFAQLVASKLGCCRQRCARPTLTPQCRPTGSAAAPSRLRPVSESPCSCPSRSPARSA